MNYFGTDLTTHGHYIFELEDNRMTKTGIDFRGLPFHPEELTNNLPKGEVIFYQGGGYTVLGISGSCKDTRPGTKSIFWIDKIVTKSELSEILYTIPIAKTIIDQMDFVINW